MHPCCSVSSRNACFTGPSNRPTNSPAAVPGVQDLATARCLDGGGDRVPVEPAQDAVLVVPELRHRTAAVKKCAGLNVLDLRKSDISNIAAE